MAYFWIVISIIATVWIFGWWGLLVWALLVGVFALILFGGKQPILPSQQNNSLSQNSNDVRCPKCLSKNISANKKGFSVGQAVAGGIVGGMIGSNKIQITCLSCGNIFKPGEGK